MDAAASQSASPHDGPALNRTLADIPEDNRAEEEEPKISRNQLFSGRPTRKGRKKAPHNGKAAVAVGKSTQKRPPLPENNDNIPPVDRGSEPDDVGMGGTPKKPPAEPSPMASPDRRKLPNFERMEAQFEAGYDSDGNEPPPGTSDDIDFEEEELVVTQPQPQEEEEEPIDTTPRHIPMDEESLGQLTLPMIKHELTIRGVPYKGSGPSSRKEELLLRLRDALSQEIKVTIFLTPKQIAEAKKSLPKGSKRVDEIQDDLVAFAPGSHWVPLDAEPEVVLEPVNTIPKARAPTVPAWEKVPVKHNYAHTFDRPVFGGRKNVPKRNVNGKQHTGPNGQPLFNKTDITRTPRSKVGISTEAPLIEPCRSS